MYCFNYLVYLLSGDEMSTKIENIGDIAVITLYLSRATMDRAADFKEYMMSTIELGNKNLVVDLSLCDYVDSTFLGVLVISLKKVNAQGGHLVLVIKNQVPLGMMRETKMDKIFQIFSEIDDAITALKK